MLVQAFEQALAQGNIGLGPDDQRWTPDAGCVQRQLDALQAVVTGCGRSHR